MQDETIKELALKVKDESRPLLERREALKLICSMRGESTFTVNQIPEQDLSFVVSAMVYWPEGIKPLSCEAAAEAVREGRMRRESSRQRR